MNEIADDLIKVSVGNKVPQSRCLRKALDELEDFRAKLDFVGQVRRWISS